MPLEPSRRRVKSFSRRRLAIGRDCLDGGESLASSTGHPPAPGFALCRLGRAQKNKSANCEDVSEARRCSLIAAMSVGRRPKRVAGSVDLSLNHPKTTQGVVLTWVKFRESKSRGCFKSCPNPGAGGQKLLRKSEAANEVSRFESVSWSTYGSHQPDAAASCWMAVPSASMKKFMFSRRPPP